MAHFMMNQRGFIFGFRNGHETGCTDRVERSVVITPMWKDSFPRSIHGSPNFWERDPNYKAEQPSFVQFFLNFSKLLSFL
jgi:hypothetical protein